MQTALFSTPYLFSLWAGDYADWCANGGDDALVARLQAWADKPQQKETTAQAAFEQSFFVELWGYRPAGAQSAEPGHTLESQYAIERAGQTGGIGFADLALGWFDQDLPAIPQVLCEFKDIKSGLDAAQARKGNDRSPVKQCADYLKFAREQHDPFDAARIKPTWGIVSDMREIRLYWRARMPQQYECFVTDHTDLLKKTETARRRRFLFARLLHRDWLLDAGHGVPLLKLLAEQRTQEKQLEKTFYFEYRAYREHVFRTLLAANPEYKTRAADLVGLTQKLLDRLLFVLFCEDMGAHLDFPVNLLRELLREAANNASYDPTSDDLWRGKINRLFGCMRDGKPFSEKSINRFNGGLFAADAALDGLVVPDALFCAKGEGDNASPDPLTLLYFSVAYNFGVDADGARSIGLYTLGRIFEQSITDLEILEAEAAHAPSLMKLGKRKTDGVYYTPEWVTAYLVEETLGRHLAGLRAALPAAPDEAVVKADHTKTGRIRNKTCASAVYLAALAGFETALNALRVLDPACGSGAFLIQALTRLIAEHEWLAAERARVSYEARQSGLYDIARAYRDVLAHNLYGVDVNAESVEITKLALWLHTALPGKPLSTLDARIVCGNSLVGRDIEAAAPLSPEARRRVNPFDIRDAFPDVFAAGGFDVIVGNPPYIKLQNMRQVQPEATDYWIGETAPGQPRYASAQTGNYDIYLLFIEQALRWLAPAGRLGYIAPSVWNVNEYGAGLRGHLAATRQLERWIDFADHQIFDEAITYTALQFFTGTPNDGVKLAFAPRGADDLAALDWDAVPARTYASLPADGVWEFMPEAERALIERLRAQCRTLDESCDGIMVGIQTSADPIYHLTRLGPGRYLSHADKAAPVEVDLEDAVLRPLVSGPEAKRYLQPVTDTWLLFPYDLSGARPVLFSAAKLEADYPLAWAYLKRHEAALRGRESGKMDKGGWYGYVYPKNLDKQEKPKLIVAQTVPSLRVCFDADAGFYLNNVRVNGILPTADCRLPTADCRLPTADCRQRLVPARRVERASRGLRVPPHRQGQGRRLLRSQQAVHRAAAHPRRERG